MRVSISGSTGFIGGELVRRFSGTDWTFSVINRDSLLLDDAEFIRQKIDGADVVINLAGMSLAHRWTAAYKNEILHSRIDTTRKIAQCIKKSQLKPKIFISTSAIGIYDSSGIHTEESTAFADDFLGQVCRQWETEAHATENDTRLVIVRNGVVLGTAGGMLASIHKFFNIGLGGIIGDGRQAFSWIHIRDLLRIYEFIITNNHIRGVVNAVAPNPTTNYHFTKTYGKVLLQPAIMKVPAFLLKSVYGEGAGQLMKGQQVIPDVLLKNGFSFEFPTVESALLNLYRI
jgi:uncharacterized protein